MKTEKHAFSLFKTLTKPIFLANQNVDITPSIRQFCMVLIVCVIVINSIVLFPVSIT